MSEKESVVKTLTVATAVGVVCAIIVSVSSVALKPLQERNKALDRQINVLKAAGLVAPGEKTIADVAKRKLADALAVVVDLESGEIVPGADPSAVENDPANVVELDEAVDVAGIKTAPKQAVVHLFRNAENGALQTVVLPIKGTGLWSTTFGFLALKADLRTVENVVFYEHGETPGLGGEISNPKWTAKWNGKIALSDDGVPILRVVKGVVDPASPDAKSEIDGISGATLTGNGVCNTTTFWLGENGFGPFLKRGLEPLQAALDADGKESQK